MLPVSRGKRQVTLLAVLFGFHCLSPDARRGKARAVKKAAAPQGPPQLHALAHRLGAGSLVLRGCGGGMQRSEEEVREKGR